MIVEFDKSFDKSLNRLNDKSLYPKIQKLFLLLDSAKNIQEIPNVKKLNGFKSYYRLRIGDYRLGFEKINEKTVRLIIIAHRKNIYNLFP
jgi:mRNA interferase RelE/StbE